MRRTVFRLPVLILLCAAALFASACSSGEGPDGLAERPILVGAFDFPESQVLANIYAAALNEHGYRATLLENVASREIMEPALEQGKVDLVPEYLGTALAFIDPDSEASDSSRVMAHRTLTEAFGIRGVSVMSPAPGENKNEIVVTEATAREYGLRDISDLQPFAPELIFGGPPECPSRPHCLAGLQGEYGLQFEDFHALDAGGPLTVSALRAGEIDVALLFTTSPEIDEFGFVVLRDDRKLQPAENVVPVVRERVVEEEGRSFQTLVDRVTAKLTTDALRNLNERVSRTSPSELARQWLTENGLTS